MSTQPVKTKVALITGFTGQDGRYLARLLLDKGYKVYGMVRRSSHPDFSFIEEMGLQAVEMVEGDLSDSGSLGEIIRQSQPDEIYNLGAMSHVGTSFHQPEYTIDVTGVGTLRLLEQIRLYCPTAKMYQAGSSEQFGDVAEIPQKETTEYRPRSPYAAAKVFAHHICKVYRESYGIFACSAVLFNHDSIFRGVNFVTRKITDYIGQYINGHTDKPLELGYIDSKRDWSFAGDMVEGMWRILQQDKPDDFVLSSNETHTVREFAELAFARAGITLGWRGEGVDEVGFNLEEPNKVLIKVNPEYYRPAEVPLLLGDSTKARTVLGWKPKVSFPDLVKMMVDYDIKRYKNVHTKYQTDNAKATKPTNQKSSRGRVSPVA